jgi:hypothetical protein
MPEYHDTPPDDRPQPYNTRHAGPLLRVSIPYRPRKFNRLSRRRFERIRAAELMRHFGRTFTIPEQILVSRICAIEYDLIRLDAKLDAGITLSAHDIRGRLAAENRLRLDLVALGLERKSNPPPSLSDLLKDRSAA